MIIQKQDIDNVAEEIRSRDRNFVWHTWSPLNEDRSRLTFSQGEGYFVWDINGKMYFDAASLNLVCGYSHPQLSSAITNQVLKFHGTDISIASHEMVGLLAQRLSKHLPDGLSKTLFVNSGSEGIEAAVFIAASYWENIGQKRSKLVTFARGYHGSTFLTRSLSGLTRIKNSIFHPIPVTHVELPVEPKELRKLQNLGKLIDCFKKAIWDNNEVPVAVIVEPFLNVGGGIVLPKGFLKKLRSLCDEVNTLLIIDEVFTGHGRTGKMFAFQHEDIEPDILISSKGLASGYMPITAVNVQKEIQASFVHDPYIAGLRYGHTTSGHAVACSAAIAALELIESENLCQRAVTNGTILLEKIVELFASYEGVIDIRGLGLIIVIEMESLEKASHLQALAESFGLLLRKCGEALMIVPPLMVDDKGINIIIDCLKACVTSDEGDKLCQI